MLQIAPPLFSLGAGRQYAHVFRLRKVRTSALPVVIAVLILCTSCKLEFWVIQQKPETLIGILHPPGEPTRTTSTQGSRLKTTAVLTPGQTSSTAKPEVDSRLLARIFPTTDLLQNSAANTDRGNRSRTLSSCVAGPTPHHG